MSKTDKAPFGPRQAGDCGSCQVVPISGTSLEQMLMHSVRWG